MTFIPRFGKLEREDLCITGERICTDCSELSKLVVLKRGEAPDCYKQVNSGSTVENSQPESSSKPSSRRLSVVDYLNDHS